MNGNKALLKIIDAILAGISEDKSIHQIIVQKTAEILEVERCVMFLISTNNNLEVICEITAGVPEGEHGIGWNNKIENHDDLLAVLEEGKLLHINNPTSDKRTRYFIKHIVAKNISEILYIPIILKRTKKGRRLVGILVLDKLHEKKFNEEEKEICADIGELISKFINREEEFILRMRDRFLNKIVSIGGPFLRILNLTKKLIPEMEVFQEKIKNFESEIPSSSLFGKK